MSEQGRGPVYGVELIDTLPISNGMMQAMPNQFDLVHVRRYSERTVAGYEVLLNSHKSLEADNAKLRRMLAMAYSGPVNLYGDDGELSDCSKIPFIDYVRDSIDTIAQAIQQRGENEVAKAQFAQQLWHETGGESTEPSKPRHSPEKLDKLAEAIRKN